jgi:hypothetical protein
MMRAVVECRVREVGREQDVRVVWKRKVNDPTCSWLLNICLHARAHHRPCRIFNFFIFFLVLDSSLYKKGNFTMAYYFSFIHCDMRSVFTVLYSVFFLISEVFKLFYCLLKY